MANPESVEPCSDKGLCVLDDQGRVLFADAAAAALLGVEKADCLSGRMFDAFIAESDREVLKAKQQGTDREPWRATLKGADGVQVPVQLTCHGFFSDTGVFKGAAVLAARLAPDGSSIDDVSRRLEMALIAGALGAWRLDLSSGEAWRTSEHDRIFGYDEGLPRWTLETFLNHVLEEDRPAVIQTLADAVSARTDWRFECRIRRADAVTRWIWAQGRFEYDLQDEPLGLFGVVKDISERKETEEQIAFLAYYDPLTKLPNRRLLADRLGQAVRAAQRSGRPGALLFIDLDDFKTLNDTLGHHTGDRMLLEAARRLLSCLRSQDTVARLGGDEFVVVMEGLDSNLQTLTGAVQTVADKILAAISEPYDFSLLSPTRTTCSVGAVTFGERSDTPESLLERADLAMYRAKEAGGDSVQFYRPKMQAAIDKRVALESEILIGLEQAEFVLHYQPQIDLQAETVSAEALIRWRHPKRGMIGPREFIPEAEESGLIIPLGRFVLEAACQQLRDWAKRSDTGKISIAVNVSSRQFHHPDFVKDVLRAIDSTGIDARKLVIELTESALLDNVDDAVAKMSELKARSVRFSLDNFGTGYSSLYYLKKLPLDQLKIDQRFVGDVVTDTNDAAIVRSIIALADSLSLSVIAEGVESKQTSGFLLEHQCHWQQGYLFSKALRSSDFEAFLRGRSAQALH